MLMLEELFHHDPEGSLQFLNGLMHAGFLHGCISVVMMFYTIWVTWGSEAVCDQPLSRWIFMQCILQCVQFFSRWKLYASLPPCSGNDPDMQDEWSQQTIERLSNVVHSSKWTVNRVFGLIALVWFFLGTWWVFETRGCNYTPVLWNTCATLLWLFCIRTAFVYMWFGYCFSGQAIGVAYAGPFTRPGMSRSQLARIEESTVGEDDLNVGEDTPQCAICLAEFELNEPIRRLSCTHFFHVKCVDKWLKVCSTCPLCNDDLRNPRSKTEKNTTKKDD